MSDPPGLSDLDVYRALSEVADALEQLAAQAATLVGETALVTAARSARAAAQAVYDYSVNEGMRPN